MSGGGEDIGSPLQFVQKWLRSGLPSRGRTTWPLVLGPQREMTSPKDHKLIPASEERYEPTQERWQLRHRLACPPEPSTCPQAI